MVADSRQAITESEFEAAFAREWRPVFRFALASTNDYDAAADLAQEAFARLWQHRTDVDWSRPVLPWLLVVTRRLATDRFRRMRRQLFSAPPAAVPDGVRERWLDTRDAMALLSSTERLAIVLTTIDGYASDEAGLLLGISAGAVRAAVSRARDKLEAAQ